MKKINKRINRILLFISFVLICGLINNQAFSANTVKHQAQKTDSALYFVEVDKQIIEFKKQDFKSIAQNNIKESNQTADNNKKADRNEIKELAKEYGLLEESKMNPHLSFLDGDIAYWDEQGLSIGRLRLEFAARKAVLDAADKSGVVIADQGKLSWAAQKIMAQILKEQQEILKKEKESK